MQAQTVHYVSFTDVLSRLGLPSQEDVDDFVDFFYGWGDYAVTAASFSLVPWSVLADDLTDCCIELGYGAPDINKIFPRTVEIPGHDRCAFTDHIYVDLES